MKIKLCFPIEGIQAIQCLGLRQSNPETLRLVLNGARPLLLRGKSGEQLTPDSFSALINSFGAWIETDSTHTQSEVTKSLQGLKQESLKFIKVSSESNMPQMNAREGA